jgi:hypothetical protein
MAAHYDVGILPARPRKPRDKAAVEAGVRFAQTYVLGRLRNQTFFSLAEANAAKRARKFGLNIRASSMSFSISPDAQPSSGEGCTGTRTRSVASNAERINAAMRGGPSITT